MKKLSRLTALLLALMMLAGMIPASALAETYPLSDYQSALSDVQTYGLIDAAYEYYVGQLEELDLAGRFETLKTWHDGLLGDLFYDRFIGYYEQAHAGEDLICTCDQPLAHGGLAHGAQCAWSFANLADEAKVAILNVLEGSELGAYLAALPTAAASLANGGVRVQGEMPSGANLAVEPLAVPQDAQGLLAFDIKVQWNGFDWQPGDALELTIENAWDPSLENPYVDVVHLLDTAEAVLAAQADGSLLTADDPDAVAAYPAETAAAQAAGIGSVVPYTVISSRDGQVALNDDGSVSFEASSFSDFYVYSGTGNTKETLGNNERHDLYMYAGTSATFTCNNAAAIAGTTDFISAKRSNTTLTISVDENAPVGSTTEITVKWKSGNQTRTAYINVTVIDDSSTERVYVYVAGLDHETKIPMAGEFLELLGVNKLDANNYFPAGEIELPVAFLKDVNADQNAVIDESSDWDIVMNALAKLDTTTLTGEFEVNRGNKIAAYNDKIEKDIGEVRGSQMSALFSWDGHSEGFDDNKLAGYHLDLRYSTRTITFITGNNGIDSGEAKDGTTVDHRVYITGSEIQEPRNLKVPNGYQFVGYYADANFTTPWNGIGTPLNEDEVVYIKITEKDNIVLNYEIAAGEGSLSLHNEGLNPDTGIPVGSTPTAANGYKFDGWYTDKDCTTSVPVNWVEDNNKITPQKIEGKFVTATYYAKFVENEVTIKYVAVGPNGKQNDGSGTVTPTSETVGVVTGTAQGSTPTAAENYKFVNWYLDEACTQLVSNLHGTVDATTGKFTPAKEPEVKDETTGEVTTPAMYASATYYAKFEYNLTTLTIKKTGLKQNTDADRESAIFVVTDEGNKEIAQVVIPAGDADGVTIDNLTVGKTYTVTELNAWTWRYEDQSAKPVTIQAPPTANEVTFENEQTNDYWLGGDNVKVNVFGTGNSN